MGGGGKGGYVRYIGGVVRVRGNIKDWARMRYWRGMGGRKRRGEGWWVSIIGRQKGASEKKLCAYIK